MKTRDLYSKLSRYETQKAILKPRLSYVNSMKIDWERFMKRICNLSYAISLIRDEIALEGIRWPLNDSQIPF